MYLKMMGLEDLPDSDSRKSYRLIQQVVDVKVERRDDGKTFVSYSLESGKQFMSLALGNIYILNDQGKTISTYGVANPVHDIGKAR